MRAELVVEFVEICDCCGTDMTDNDRVSFAVIYFPRSL